MSKKARPGASFFESKIRNKEYQSASRAAFALTRSKLSAKDKHRLSTLIPKFYLDKEEFVEPPETATFSGAAAMEGIKQTIQSSEKKELQHDLMRLSIQVLNLALKYRLTRDEAFERLKAVLTA